MKNSKITDLTSLLEYNPDISFTMVFMKKNKIGKLSTQEVGKDITPTPLDEFLDFFNYAKKDAV